MMLTNAKRDQILDRLYERFDGRALSNLITALETVLTGDQLDQMHNGKIVTIDPSTNSALLVMSARLAVDLGYDPDDPDVYRWIIDPLINPQRR